MKSKRSKIRQNISRATNPGSFKRKTNINSGKEIKKYGFFNPFKEEKTTSVKPTKRFSI